MDIGYPKINITVGIPLYNAEQYISKTLKSILSQNIDSMEVIVVDDCGTDNSLKLVEFARDNEINGNCIRIIKHSHNKGVAEARNTIIKESKGKYLFFIDSDDELYPDSLTLLYNKAEEYHSEATFGSFSICKNDTIDIFRQLPDTLLLGEDKLAEFFYNSHKDNILCSSCNILLLKSFLINNNVLFPPLNYGEDLLFDYKMIPLIKRAVLISNLTYIYNIHPNSLSNYQSRRIIDISEAKRALHLSQLIKNTCKDLCNKSYYANKCAKDLKQILFFICGIIKHRHQLNGDIEDKELRNALKHPASFFEILKFKKERSINMLFYFIGICPPKITVWMITYIGKKRKYI